MQMLWNNMSRARTLLLQNFGKGLNTDVDPSRIDVEELTDCKNITCDDYPVIRTRNDRVVEDCDALTLPKGIGARGSSQMHAFDNGTWSYRTLASTSWTPITASLTTASTQVSFHEFNTYGLTTDNTTGSRLKYSICACANSSDRHNGYWSEDSTFEAFTTSYTEPSTGSTYTNYPPQSNLLTVHKYRVYGFDKDYRTIRYSELGNPVWFKAANYLDVTEMRGAAQAIVTYADHVIAWGEHSMHELYGESVYNFEFVNVSNTIGCVGKYAYTECNGYLFWLDYNGVYVYTGGKPRLIGEKAKKYLEGINWTYRKLICMGSFDTKLYIALPYKSTANNRLVVIDIGDLESGLELVSIEDDADIQSFVNIADKLYGLNNDGRIWDMCSTYKTGYDNSTAISWSFETQPLSEEALNVNSGVRDVWIEHQGSTNASMTLRYSTNSHSTTFSTFMATTDFTTSSTNIIVDRYLASSTELQGITHVKFQFAGNGYKKIYGLQANILSYGDLQ